MDGGKALPEELQVQLTPDSEDGSVFASMSFPKPSFPPSSFLTRNRSPQAVLDAGHWFPAGLGCSSSQELLARLLPEFVPHFLLIRARGESETEREEEKNCSKLFMDNIIMCHNSVSVMGKSECGRGWGSTGRAAQ